MTQYGPVTAPGSQGGFSGQGCGFKMGARQLTFSELVLSCPVAGTSAQFSTCRKIQTIEFRDKRICLFGLKTSDNLNWFHELCTGPHESENGSIRNLCFRKTDLWNQYA
jgi:hypothetical protein